MGRGDKTSIVYIWILLVNIVQKAFCQCSGSPLTVSASEEPAKFISPGYPTSYTNDLTCQWLIDSGVAGQKIILYSDNINVDCAFGDIINIYDGSSTSDTTLHTNLCGTTLKSNEYISSGRYVLVEFTSDSATVGPGFEMTYLSAADTSGTGCSSEYTLTASTTSQYLTSQSFPALYAGSSSCRWLLTASNTQATIDFQVVWSDVETDANCAYDKLVIYDGRYVCENKVLLTDCSARTSADDTPTVFTSSSYHVLVTFSSDQSFNRYGFVIKFTENQVNTTTTTTVTQASTTQGSSGQAVRTETIIKTEVSIALMAASAVAGAISALGIVATIWVIKYIKAKKKIKKGLITVHSIAPLPARQTVFAPRQPTNVLSFV
ncbi:cubilin-like [Ruditapes philippinarum]|uniref:cubilin-like n=1 Tax=Ruditapes philippinarum TaxID=129788 RepID=UPI00295B2F1B|nr:cubilin-like [Ruditapes philippinarum]XP_060565671.1 cubilin-like [Ruditapes philippinarum]XP_060565672.1 cubilin-like [Ruditapes philippinarum]